MNNQALLKPNNCVFSLKTETERGADAYVKGYHSGLSSLHNRISHHLSASIRLKTYSMDLKSPMISFTFDDISQSAALEGAQELETNGIKGTFYIASDLIGRHISGSIKATKEEIKTLHDNGHEIGLHTHSHLPAFSYSNYGFKADLKDNIDILSEFIKLNANPNFCYPYGITSLQAKLSLQKMARSARVLWDDINHKQLDPYFLRSAMLDSSAIDLAGIAQLIQQTIDKKGWLIFCSHCVGEKNAVLSTPKAHLREAIKLAKENNFEIVTINEGLNRLSVPH